MRCALLVSLFALLLISVPLRADVREAASVTWFHGITAEIAQSEIGVEGVPALRRLLFDDDYEHRDNVVAYLGWLGSQREARLLARFVAQPVARRLSPEDDRARLLAPVAVGQIAGRDERAVAVLFELLDAKLPADLHAQALHGLAWAEDRLEVRSHLDDNLLSSEWSFEALSDATHATVALHKLAVANHVDVLDFVTAARADAILARVSTVLSSADFAEDVACCVALKRASGRVKTFGSRGDGLDVIDTSIEAYQVLRDRTARIHVVRAINYCGGTLATNILGCGYVGDYGIAVVRQSTELREGVLWAHEYGHNTGLPHVADSRYLMYAALCASETSLCNRGLDAAQCDRYYEPVPDCRASVGNGGGCAP